jgi:tripartite-type tricarboxylate transporter receptor subunit TctC
MFRRSSKLDITTLAFSGTAELIPQLLGGHIQIGAGVDVSHRPHIEAGRLRPIVVSAKSTIFPDVPTFADYGYPEINLGASNPLMAPKDLPPAIFKALENALETVVKDPNYIASFKKTGYNTTFQFGLEKNKDFVKRIIEKLSQFNPEELGWK